MKYLLTKFRLLITSAAIAIFGALVMVPAPVGAVDCAATPDAAQCQVCEGVALAGGGTGCEQPADSPSVESIVKTVVNLLSLVVGIAAVIMIIIGGFKYITSSGDSANVSSAKNTILYAIIGLVVVALAQVIVRFVLNKL